MWACFNTQKQKAVAVCTHENPACSTSKRGSSSYLVRCEGAHVLQKGLPHLRAAFKHAGQLRGRQLQENAERLRLRPLAALHESLPHLGILPHLQSQRGGKK